MSKTLCLLTVTLLLGCGAPQGVDATLSAWPGEIEQWGTLREALRDGQTQARVQLADVTRPGTYAVGALAGLAGEVTVFDGEVWVSEGDREQPLTSRAQAGEAAATVLFAAHVERWSEHPLTADVDPSVLDAFLADQARLAGLDPSQPFPFVIEGPLQHLGLHVIAGECPKRAAMLGQELQTPPYELHADSITARLVGIYAPESSGVMCHAGARSHVHALLEDGDGLTGHVDSVGLLAGAVLRLPAP